MNITILCPNELPLIVHAFLHTLWSWKERTGAVLKITCSSQVKREIEEKFLSKEVDQVIDVKEGSLITSPPWVNDCLLLCSTANRSLKIFMDDVEWFDKVFQNTRIPHIPEYAADYLVAKDGYGAEALKRVYAARQYTEQFRPTPVPIQ